MDKNEALKSLKRIDETQLNIDLPKNQQFLLCPKNVKIEFNSRNLLKTTGLGELDKKQKDLLTYIRIIDAINIKYQETNILMPRTYAECLSKIPEHISVQCLLFSKLGVDGAEFINEFIEHNPYGKTDYDKFFITRTKKQVKTGDIVYLMNRRVGGWDGSPERPVIELLCAGGHLATMWSDKKQKFIMSNFISNLQRELVEELKIKLATKNFIIFGGFHNQKSNELVILCGAFVKSSDIKKIYQNTKNNYKENIAGIYVGYFDDVMKMYNQNPTCFAGGEGAKSSNFPSQKSLMTRVKDFLKNKK